MPNKKTKPAAGKSVAGKNNSKKNSSASQKAKEKQRAREIKNAQRIVEEKQKKQEAMRKKSKEIQKRRAKQKELEEKSRQKQQDKQVRSGKRKEKLGLFKTIWDKIKYYTSKEFLNSFNYVRIFIFVIVPVVALIFGIVTFSQSVIMNVPISIRSADFNGRIESDLIAKKSVFNTQQQEVFTDSLGTKGTHKFKFYINSVVSVDDNNSTSNLCFGSSGNDGLVMIATIYDKKGEILYRSLGLENGKEINEATFFKSLSYGVHDVKVAVNAYDSKTDKKIGTKYAKIKLAVGVDYNGK